ncbi:hypothetical protein GSI_09867 [Ganoderma sinense ZZ0214-1]|uniref:Uncharacterized protein n=1 Tax=Ganoderma sinense ZZ0214-1 TaxID=1077348 RepID=A0A2G8S2M1_9APHY|nr:hypothetical protein GSI_09867 [Ganoderma sinense ZZ0214-1]
MVSVRDGDEFPMLVGTRDPAVYMLYLRPTLRPCSLFGPWFRADSGSVDFRTPLVVTLRRDISMCTVPSRPRCPPSPPLSFRPPTHRLCLRLLGSLFLSLSRRSCALPQLFLHDSL